MNKISLILLVLLSFSSVMSAEKVEIDARNKRGSVEICGIKFKKSTYSESVSFGSSREYGKVEVSNNRRNQSSISFRKGDFNLKF